MSGATRAETSPRGSRPSRAARRRNVERLRAVPASAWKRAGFQESIGQITLADVPRLMAEHDRAHTDEIRGLLAYLRTGRDARESAPDFGRRLVP